MGDTIRINIPIRKDLKEKLDNMSAETGISLTSLISMSSTWLVKNYEQNAFFSKLLPLPDSNKDFDPYVNCTYEKALEKLDAANLTAAYSFLASWTSSDGSKRGWDSMTKNKDQEFIKLFGQSASDAIWRNT